MEVRNLRSGRILYARNAEKNFKPASTLKVVTTAAALDAFGPDARLQTTVETAGRLDAFGRIVGDVYLVGGGDPNLSGRFHEGRAMAPFEQLAAQLETAGVRRIEGRVLGHEGFFGGERRGEDWAWGDLVWCYGAEVSALALNDNCVDLTVAPGEREGDDRGHRRLSAVELLQDRLHRDHVRSCPRRVIRLERDLGGKVFRLTGSAHGVPWQGSVAVEDPARFAATVFRPRSWPRRDSSSPGGGHQSAPLPAAPRPGHPRKRPAVGPICSHQQAEPEPAHRDAAAPAGRASAAAVGSAEAGRRRWTTSCGAWA